MKKGGLLLLILLLSCISFSQDSLHFKWMGGTSVNGYDAYSWNALDNWEIWIPESENDIDPETDNGDWVAAWTLPRHLDYCIIPAGRNYYPKYPAFPNWENASMCYQLVIKPGASINWISPDNEKYIHLDVSGNLIIQNENNVAGALTINKNAKVEIGNEELGTGDLHVNGTVSLLNSKSTLVVNKDLTVNNFHGLSTLGDVTINGNTHVLIEEGIVIEADESGAGSFINQGTLNFSSHAGAKVETFLSSTVGNYFMHFVGPTLLDSSSSYRGGNISGVRLHQFDISNLITNRYEWNALTDTTNHQVYPWTYVQPLDYNVPSANGIAVSHIEKGARTIEMSGTFISEDVIYTIRPHQNNNLELVSNPFSAAISFDDLYNYGNNSDVIKGHFWIYDASTGNYYGGALGSDTSMIQVGQGFFVEVNGSGGELVFNPSIRNHNKVVFRDLNTNVLKLHVTGGDAGYKDELTISFDGNATDGYDENLEAKKWNSFGSDATMIRSITEDGSELSVNVLPTASLYNPMTSIPIYFECGYNAEYTFNLSGIETFEYDISIWIEDLFTGNWISIPESNPSFTFMGSPNDNKERFVLHFMGPTAVQEMNAVKKNQSVQVYSSSDKIYIRNKSEELLQDVAIYNMLGQEIYRNNSPEQNLNQILIKGITGYYVVRIRTDRSLISEKVFIYN